MPGMTAVLALGLLSQSVFFATKRWNGLGKDMTFLFHVSGNATTFEDGVGAPFFSPFFLFPLLIVSIALTCWIEIAA